MRLYSAREIALKDADQLCPEGSIRSHGSGHNPEQAAFGERNDRAQKLFGLASRKCNHRLTHDWNAHFIGETPANFLAVDKSHGWSTLYPTAIASANAQPRRGRCGCNRGRRC